MILLALLGVAASWLIRGQLRSYQLLVPAVVVGWPLVALAVYEWRKRTKD